METPEIVDGLKDLIKDREALIEPDAPQDDVFTHDKIVLQSAVDELSRRAEQVSTESKPFPLGQWNYPEEVPTHNNSEIVNCLVIVRGVQTGIVRMEESEYRYGEWDISNAWNLIAWISCPAPENKPLTLDELREMDGEPVWVKEIDGTGCGEWTIIDIGAQTEMLKALSPDTGYEEYNYGKTWFAYARKPAGDVP